LVWGLSGDGTEFCAPVTAEFWAPVTGWSPHLVGRGGRLIRLCRGGARGARGATAPQNFAWPPSGPPKFFRSFSESPTQTIDSSPCCKTGPSSGPKYVCFRPCGAVFRIFEQLALALKTELALKFFNPRACHPRVEKTIKRETVHTLNLVKISGFEMKMQLCNVFLRNVLRYILVSRFALNQNGVEQCSSIFLSSTNP